MLLRITQYGEPVLKEKGAPVTEFNDELRKLADDMVETMREAEGIGLAAQQIGKAIQMFVMEVPVYEDQDDPDYLYDGKHPPLDLIMPLAVINAELTLSGEEAPYEEGCLSFPGIRGKVERPTRLRMRFQDLDGNPHEIVCDGLFARIIQHEYDHTQGVLFIDRMNPRVLRPLESKIRRLRRDTRDFLKSQN
ncbi:peptide deformylase [Ruficoccus amylovorans]|uniref:Peptide deformylase n=1 Tax=Ruficoccus amylovorans TaxID=1804625 RepID=A0A842H9S1_9BACT|nr:peptide deformylase [Ruficoccus amylovorans]MBC2593060.1 peptide deformylase [Ruficoccus amylovorans]